MSQEDVNNFHAHLDKCEQCANNPFNLCQEGKRLINKTFKGRENVKPA